MSDVLFFEKPGCANNARQKSWLAAAGHRIEARNLLTHAWSSAELHFIGAAERPPLASKFPDALFEPARGRPTLF